MTSVNFPAGEVKGIKEKDTTHLTGHLWRMVEGNAQENHVVGVADSCQFVNDGRLHHQAYVVKVLTQHFPAAKQKALSVHYGNYMSLCGLDVV